MFSLSRNISRQLLIFLSLFIYQINCQSKSGMVFGIGAGTFIIIIAIVFSVFWCLICRNSSRPQLYSIIGVIIPVVLILVFIFMPKQKDRSNTTGLTDSNFVPHVIFFVISIIGFVIGLVFITIKEVFTFKKAKNVARSAFVVKQEEQDKINSQSQINLSQQQNNQRISQEDNSQQPL